MSHQCPVSGCERVEDDSKLMCRSHWAMVPRLLQQAVYRAYGRGRGLGSLALLRAQAAAIGAVEHQFAERERPSPTGSAVPTAAGQDERKAGRS